MKKHESMRWKRGGGRRKTVEDVDALRRLLAVTPAVEDDDAGGPMRKRSD